MGGQGVVKVEARSAQSAARSGRVLCRARGWKMRDERRLLLVVGRSGDEVDLNCLLFSIHFPMYKIIMYKSTHSLHLVPGDEQVE